MSLRIPENSIAFATAEAVLCDPTAEVHCRAGAPDAPCVCRSEENILLGMSRGMIETSRDLRQKRQRMLLEVDVCVAEFCKDEAMRLWDEKARELRLQYQRLVASMYPVDLTLIESDEEVEEIEEDA